MGLKFRLRDLAETFIDEIVCPECAQRGVDEEMFATEHTRVTFEGIIVVVQCQSCQTIFVPNSQRLGVLNPRALREAVERDSQDHGEPLFPDFHAVKISAERMNASRKGDLH